MVKVWQIIQKKMYAIELNSCIPGTERWLLDAGKLQPERSRYACCLWALPVAIQQRYSTACGNLDVGQNLGAHVLAFPFSPG